MMEFASNWGMALFCAHALFCVVTALYMRRDSSHAPIFYYMFGFFVIDRARTLTGMILDGRPVPYVGVDALVLHADRLLYLTANAGFTWLCGHMFQSKSTKIFAIASLVLPLAFLMATYPQAPRTVGIVYAGTQSLALGVAWIAAFRAALGYADVRPQFLHLVVLILLGADSTSFLLVYLDNFAGGIAGISAEWSPIMSATFLAYVICISLYVARLIVPGPTSPKPNETPS